MTYQNTHHILRAAAAAFLTPIVAGAAGVYSAPSGTTAGAIDNPIPRSAFTVFESSVASYDPAPGVGGSYKAYATGIASLGELYSPIAPPAGATTFNPAYQPITGKEPSASHAGTVTDNFSGNLTSTTDTYGFIGIDTPGSITLKFDAKIYDGAGADFAVFENGFAYGPAGSLFAELAFVEVSSDGINFARFDSISLNTAPTMGSGAFAGYDMTNVYNLAGKHAANWGTPFDLAQLASNPLVINGLLDLAAVSYVRLVDVVGSGSLAENGTEIPGIAKDSQGHPILDNYVTYDSAGFDYVGLKTGAVGVIYSVPETSAPLLAMLGCCGSLLLRKRRK